MTWIQRWIDATYLWLHGLKGTSIVRRYYRSGDHCEQLSGYAIAGYEVHLYCQQMRYVRNYLNEWAPSKAYYTFRVFSRTSHDAPRSLKKACELEVDLPRMLPCFMGEGAQRHAAIQAYLDILLLKIREDTGTYNPSI